MWCWNRKFKKVTIVSSLLAGIVDSKGLTHTPPKSYWIRLEESSTFSGFPINHIALHIPEAMHFVETEVFSYFPWAVKGVYLNTYECLKCDIFSYSTLLPGILPKYWAVQFVIEQNPFYPNLDCTMYIWAHSITNLFQQEIVRLAAYPFQCRVLCEDQFEICLQAMLTGDELFVQFYLITQPDHDILRNRLTQVGKPACTIHIHQNTANSVPHVLVPLYIVSWNEVQ